MGGGRRRGSSKVGIDRDAGKAASSVPDTANGKCSLLLATVLTVESRPAGSKVVEPCTGGIDLRSRPVKSVGFQSRILAVAVAAPAEHGVESRVASCQQRRIGRFALVLRILADTPEMPGQLPPFVVRGQAPSIA